MIGNLRTRTPVAYQTAFATTPAVPVIPISPTPLMPSIDVRIVLLHQDGFERRHVGVHRKRDTRPGWRLSHGRTADPPGDLLGGFEVQVHRRLRCLADPEQGQRRVHDAGRNLMQRSPLRQVQSEGNKREMVAIRSAYRPSAIPES